jgi:hypothetical protein
MKFWASRRTEGDMKSLMAVEVEMIAPEGLVS